MKAAGHVVVVTGGAGGIGRALAERFHRDGAKTVVIADLDTVGRRCRRGRHRRRRDALRRR